MLGFVFKNLSRRKLRTGLTIFGIALGIFALIVMGGMSEYLNSVVEKSTKLMANNIQVQPEGVVDGIGIIDESKVGQVKRLPGISDAFGVLVTSLDPEGIGGFTPGNMVLGIPPEKQMKSAKLSDGRYLSPSDSYNIVVGNNIARRYNLKIGDDYVLKNKRTRDRIYTRNVTVIGILEFTGSMFDNTIQIPLRSAQEFYNMNNIVSFIYAVPTKGVDTEEVSQIIELNVEKVRGISPKKLKEQYKAQLYIFSLITVSAAILAAIIGGLSVMNTMLMSVSERTKEFGILKSLGAGRINILIMTMEEAAIIGFIGGIFGIVTGGALINFLNDASEAAHGTVIFILTPRLIIVSLVFAISLGIICGSYPAYKAAILSPLEALRNE